MYKHGSWLMMTHGHLSNLQASPPLLLVHYQGNRTLEQVTAMAELTYTGDIGKVALVTSESSIVKRDKRGGHEKLSQNVLTPSKATKEIIEILAPLENKSAFILIEGAPGIGKVSFIKRNFLQMG